VKAYDVVVVGSGPAGTSAARVLAMHGLSVAMLEKERLPRHKVCGGGIVYRARDMLDVDIAPVVRSECRKVSMTLINSGASYTVSREVPIISMVMRADFDALLANKAGDAGAELLAGCHVDAADFHDDGVVLQTSRGAIRAGFVIAADGANSIMARLAGWKRLDRLAPAIECEFEVPASDYARLSDGARFDFDMPANGYGWVFPKGDHLGVGIGGFGGGSGKVNLKRCLNEYLQWLRLPLPEPEQLSGYVIPLLPRQDGFVCKRVFLTGDAAGLADPISAEGISNAIHTGMMAAKSIVDGEMDEKRSADLYEAAMARELLPELAAGRKLARIFYASQAIRAWLMRQHGERMVGEVTRVIMGERRYTDYAEAFLNKLKLWRAK
jgi:geranylgeranyl reductase family protein